MAKYRNIKTGVVVSTGLPEGRLDPRAWEPFDGTTSRSKTSTVASTPSTPAAPARAAKKAGSAKKSTARKASTSAKKAAAAAAKPADVTSADSTGD